MSSARPTKTRGLNAVYEHRIHKTFVRSATNTDNMSAVLSTTIHNERYEISMPVQPMRLEHRKRPTDTLPYISTDSRVHKQAYLESSP